MRLVLFYKFLVMIIIDEVFVFRSTIEKRITGRKKNDKRCPAEKC